VMLPGPEGKIWVGEEGMDVERVSGGVCEDVGDKPEA
jgi:hypothetical protein